MRRTVTLLCTLLLILLGLPESLPAQDTIAQRVKPPFLLGAAAHSGWIIPHSRELVDVSTSKPYGLEVDLAWLLADERHTRASGLVAKRGVALHFVDYDDPEVLGHLFSITPYVEPMIRAQHRLHGSIRAGVGVAYLDRPYDEATNPTNLFYSTRVSFMVMMNAYLGYHLNPRWTMNAGFNFNHISNGGMRMPNKGINFPTWSLGAQYAFKPVRITRPVRDHVWRDQPRFQYQAMGSMSNKNAPAEVSGGSPVRCGLWGVMGVASGRTGRLTALGGGTEWVYDGYAAEQVARWGIAESAWKGALMAGPELLSGRVRFGIWFGAYLYAPSWEGDAIYQRYQLSYTIGKGLLIGTSLKAHRHVADVFDLRLGWVW